MLWRIKKNSKTHSARTGENADQRETDMLKIWQKLENKKVDIYVCYGALRKNLKLTPLGSKYDMSFQVELSSK